MEKGITITLIGGINIRLGATIHLIRGIKSILRVFIYPIGGITGERILFERANQFIRTATVSPKPVGLASL